MNDDVSGNGSVRPFLSPGPLAQPMSSGHNRGGVVGDRVIGMVVSEG